MGLHGNGSGFAQNGSVKFVGISDCSSGKDANSSFVVHDSPLKKWTLGGTSDGVGGAAAAAAAAVEMASGR